MKNKRALSDAAKDQLVRKPRPKIITRKRRRKNNVLTQIVVSLALGFFGGMAASRWIKLI
jgi:hypothetical protein